MADEQRSEFDAVLLEHGPRSHQVNAMLDRLRADELFLRYALGKAELHERALAEPSDHGSQSSRIGRSHQDLLETLDEKLKRDGYN